MQRSRTGESRTALLVALGAAVAVIVASGIYLIGAGSPGDDLYEGPVLLDEDGNAVLPGGPGMPQRTPRARSGDAGAEDGEDDPDDGIVDLSSGSREPFGEVFVIDLDSLRKCLELNEWEELRRQLVKMQDEGGTVPPEVVRALMDLLRNHEGRRLDAMLALGHVQDSFTAGLLAALATDESAPADARIAALDAIAKNGAPAALESVRKLVEGAKDDTNLARHAMFAVGGIGGTEGTKLLLGALAAHQHDPLSDAIVTALAKSRGGDAAISLAVREARSQADIATLDLLLRVGTQIGREAGPELRREMTAIAQSPSALAALEGDPEAAERVRFAAIYVAGMMGGEALDAVIGLVRSETGNLRYTATNALRGARGDEAAGKIVALVSPDHDVTVRRTLVAALGDTGSAVAAPAVHAALDDPEGAVVETAAYALTKLRQPSSVPVILGKLDGARTNFALARTYVEALGQIGVHDALPKLRQILESKDPAWESLRLYTQRAISRIETGDPDSIRLEASQRSR